MARRAEPLDRPRREKIAAFRLGLSAESRAAILLIAKGFSNRPFMVKRFQTNHHHSSVDVAHGLVLLFGIGTKALPSWDSKMRWNHLWVGLVV